MTSSAEVPACGLDRLLDDQDAMAALGRRRFAFLGHQATVTSRLELGHLALCRAGAVPKVLFGPEHGFYGVEQDMIASEGDRDPLSNLPVHSLYGEDEKSLRPPPQAFAEVDLLVIDLQDIGSRYYTFCATAVWAAEAAIEQGCEVWILDRHNPLGASREGPLVHPGYESFVSAFVLPVRHGLTLAQVALLECRRASWLQEPRIFRAGASPSPGSWVAPSPNMPTRETALIYPGLCLVEATELSEGRGTTRPFELIGAPYVDPLQLIQRLEAFELAGVELVPAFFRPQFQKHAGELCAGVQLIVTDATVFEPFLLGVRLIQALQELHPEEFAWRQAPYEFVSDRPAIDLLTGSAQFREALASDRPDDAVDEWIALWPAELESFRAELSELGVSSACSTA